MVKEGEKHKWVGCAHIVFRCFAAIYTLHLLPFKHKALTFVLTSRLQKTTNTLSRFKVSALSLHAIAFSHNPTSLVSHSWDMVLPTWSNTKTHKPVYTYELLRTSVEGVEKQANKWPPRTVGDPSELCFNSFLHKVRAALASSTVEQEQSGRDSQDDRLRIDQDASGQTIQLLQEAERMLKLGSLNENTEYRKTGSWNFTFTKVGRAQERKAGKNAPYGRGETSSAHDVCVCVSSQKLL